VGLGQPREYAHRVEGGNNVSLARPRGLRRGLPC
jgi:hypothetical protein